MAEHTLKRSLTIDLPRDEVFEFFSNAENLEAITPPEVGFHITTPRPIELREGTLIDYSLSLRGIPVSWRTEISVWDPPHKFVDTQLKGPYSQWIHTHTFSELGPRKTLIEDEVKYRLPLEPIGDLFHFFVEGELKKIFDYREKVVVDLLTRKDQATGHSPQ